MTKGLIIRSNDLQTFAFEEKDYRAAKAAVARLFKTSANGIKLFDTVLLASYPGEPASRYTVGELINDI